MSFDPYRDYTLEEQRTLDLSQLFAHGLRDPSSGQLWPAIQGVGAAATAIQAAADDVPVPMVGRLVTTAHEIDLARARAVPDELVEELEKRDHPALARLIRAGIAACQDDEDYRLFARWLAQVFNLMLLRQQHADPNA